MPKKRMLETDLGPAQKRANSLNVKSALYSGSLLTGVRLEGLQVTLQLQAAYHQASCYKSINKGLCRLYQISSAFQASFEPPCENVQAPVLLLKKNHGYADEKAILDAFKAFSAPQKKLNVKALLNEGNLLTGVRLEGLQVILQLREEYNQATYYRAINKALYGLYRISPAFQARFEPPCDSVQVPVLLLKKNHGYADENAIIDALKAFSAPQKSLNIKALLNEGNLLTGVSLEGLKVTLQLRAEYHQATCYKSINHALYGLYQISSTFQASFEPPCQGTQVPVLRLRANHGYADENAILDALKTFAAPQKRLNVKARLKDGSLLTGARLEGLKVTLQLRAEYHQATCYSSINHALYGLYRISSAFQESFEQPKIGIHAPFLLLKKNHGYANEHAILTALIGFAKGKIDELSSVVEEEISHHSGVVLTEEFVTPSNPQLLDSSSDDLIVKRSLADKPEGNSEFAESTLVIDVLEPFYEFNPSAMGSSGDELISFHKQLSDDDQPSLEVQAPELSLMALLSNETYVKDQRFSETNHCAIGASKDDLTNRLNELLFGNSEQSDLDWTSFLSDLIDDELSPCLRLSGSCDVELSRAAPRIQQEPEHVIVIKKRVRNGC